MSCLVCWEIFRRQRFLNMNLVCMCVCAHSAWAQTEGDRKALLKTILFWCNSRSDECEEDDGPTESKVWSGGVDVIREVGPTRGGCGGIQHVYPW